MKKQTLLFVLGMAVSAASAYATMVPAPPPGMDSTSGYLSMHEDWAIQGDSPVFAKNTVAAKPAAAQSGSLHVAQSDAGNYAGYSNNATGNRSRNTNRTYVSYTKTNPVTQKVFVGRTSGFGDPHNILRQMDAAHYMNAQGYGPAQMDRYSTNKHVIRSREINMVRTNKANNTYGRSTDGMQW